MGQRLFRVNFSDGQNKTTFMSFVTPYDFGKQRQSIKKLKHENRDFFLKYRKYKGLYEQALSQVRSFKKTSKMATVLEKMNKLRSENTRLKEKIAQMEHQKILYERFNKSDSFDRFVDSPTKREENGENEEQEQEEVDEVIEFQQVDQVGEKIVLGDDGSLTGTLKTALGLQEKRLRHFKAQFQANIHYLEENLKKEKERSTRLQKKLNHYSNHVHDLEKHIQRLEEELQEKDNLHTSIQSELDKSQGNIKELMETVKVKEEQIIKMKSSQLMEKSFFGSGLGKDLLDRANRSGDSSMLHDVSLLKTNSSFLSTEDIEERKNVEIYSAATHVLVGSDHPDSSKLVQHIITNHELCGTYSFTVVNDRTSAMEMMENKKSRGSFGCLLYFLCGGEFTNEILFRGLRQEADRCCIVGIKGLCPKKEAIMSYFNDNSFLYFNSMRDLVIQFDNVKNSERNQSEVEKLVKFLREDLVVD